MKTLAINGGKKSFEPDEFPIDEHDLVNEDVEQIMKVLDSKRYSMFNNNTINNLEHLLCDFLGVQRSAVVTNCTSALDGSLRALGIGSGDEVIMPSYTYAATMMAILSAGAKPVFVDIDYQTLTIDSSKIEEKLSSSSKAIIPVHIFGNPCEMSGIMGIADRYALRIIEDCAHSFGAKWEGKMTGTSDIGCYSFGENKILRVGEGGAVVSDDAEFMDKVEIIRHEGEIWKRTANTASKGIDLKLSDLVDGIDYVSMGHNFRYSPILAALAISRLKTIDNQIESMNQNAQIYNRHLRDIDGILIPKEYEPAERIYSSYIVLVEDGTIKRDTLLTCLAMEGVPVGVHFPTPLHKTRIYKTFSSDESFPNAERFCNNHIALPVYPNITPEHVGKICEVVSYVVKRIKEDPENLNNRARELLPKTDIKSFYSGVYITV